MEVLSVKDSTETTAGFVVFRYIFRFPVMDKMLSKLICIFFLKAVANI
jgi:hypothetical protein